MARTLVDWIAGLPEEDREWVREKLGPLFGEPRRNPMGDRDRPERPPPLEMEDADFKRVATYLDHDRDQTTPNERLLTEILEALRGVDDKLERLLWITGRIVGRMQEGPP